MGRVDAIAQSMAEAHALSTVEIPPMQDKVSAEEWKIRVDLAAAYRLVAYYGWDDLIFTHLSARVPGPEHHFLLNPYNLMFEEVTASSLVKVDMSGNPVEPTPFITNAAGFTIHSALHMAREDAQAVIHLHTPDGQAVSAHGEGLLPLTQTAMLIRDEIAYHDYEGVAVDLDERERIDRRSRRQERDDPAQPRHARARRDCRRGVHQASISSSAPARPRSRRSSAGDGKSQQPAPGLARAHRRAGQGRPQDAAPICSPGRLCSGRPTGSTRASRPERRLDPCDAGLTADGDERSPGAPRRRIVRRGRLVVARRRRARQRAAARLTDGPKATIPYRRVHEVRHAALTASGRKRPSPASAASPRPSRRRRSSR